MAPGPTARLPLFDRLIIESQSNCNRDCWFCPRTYDRSGKYLDAAGRVVLREMPTETILDLLDQAAELGFRGGVGFHHYSEPLLDKRNLQLARAARERGMLPYLHTNGDVLKADDELCERVKELYARIVVGLYDYDTDEELQVSQRWWRARLAGTNLAFSPIGRAGSRTAHSIGVPRALVPTDARMAVPDLTFANGPCHRPLIRLIVQYDGEVCNCCEDTAGVFQLGNVHHSTLADIWFSERHARILADLVAGRRDRYALCRNCPQTPTGPSPDGERMAAAPRRYRPRTEEGGRAEAPG